MDILSLSNDILKNISKPYPRKGTETLKLYSETVKRTSNFKTISPQGDGNAQYDIHASSTGSFQNHIPARGRKLLLDDAEEGTLGTISKPYPRKGTETIAGINPNRRSHVYNFKTISPQGNGAYLQPPLPERGRGTA